jgi:hypothetical protein
MGIQICLVYHVEITWIIKSAWFTMSKLHGQSKPLGLPYQNYMGSQSRLVYHVKITWAVKYVCFPISMTRGLQLFELYCSKSYRKPLHELCQINNVLTNNSMNVVKSTISHHQHSNKKTASKMGAVLIHNPQIKQLIS